MAGTLATRIEQLVEACHEAARADLVRFSSGNMSCRLDGGLMAVTAKGSWLGRLGTESIAVCRIADGVCTNGLTPSVEAGFHAGVYRARPDVNVVLHYQSPCATAISCRQPDETAPVEGFARAVGCAAAISGAQPEDIDFAVIPEVPFYVGVPAIIGYANPGSPELAAAVIAALTDHDLVLMRNHGQTAAGRDFDAVIQKAGFFELACEVLVHGKYIGPMPREGIKALRLRAKSEQSQRLV